MVHPHKLVLWKDWIIAVFVVKVTETVQISMNVHLDIFWMAETFVTKLGTVVHHYEPNVIQNDWFAVSKAKVTVRAHMIKYMYACFYDTYWTAEQDQAQTKWVYCDGITRHIMRGILLRKITNFSFFKHLFQDKGERFPKLTSIFCVCIKCLAHSPVPFRLCGTFFYSLMNCFNGRHNGFCPSSCQWLYEHNEPGLNLSCLPGWDQSSECIV